MMCVDEAIAIKNTAIVASNNIRFMQQHSLCFGMLANKAPGLTYFYPQIGVGLFLDWF